MGRLPAAGRAVDGIGAGRRWDRAVAPTADPSWSPGRRVAVVSSSPRRIGSVVEGLGRRLCPSCGPGPGGNGKAITHGAPRSGLSVDLRGPAWASPRPWLLPGLPAGGQDL